MTAAQLPVTDPVFGSTLALNTRVDGLVAGRPIAISGKRQRVRIAESASDPIMTLDEGGTITLQGGDVLWIAKLPAKPVGTKVRLQLIDRDGKTGSVDLGANEFELIAAADDDETVREVVFIDDEPTTAITHDRDRTTLELADSLVERL